MITQTQSAVQHRCSQIIKNVLMNWVAFATVLVTGFMLSPFLVRHLGDSVYGAWVLVGSLVGYLGLLDFGILPYTIKYVAEYRARGDQTAINRVVTQGLAVFSLMGLLTLVASFAAALSFNDIFKTQLSQSAAFVVVMLVGLDLAISFPASVFVGVVQGYQRHDIDAMVTSVTYIARSLLLVALVSQGFGIVALASTTFVFDMVRLAYLIHRARRLNPEIKISREFLDWREMRQLFRYSSYILLAAIGKQIIFYTDSIVVGLFLTTALVTIYSIGSRLVMYLHTLVAGMVGVLMPTASELEARGDRDGLLEMLVVSTKYVLLIALPAAAVFFIMGEQFIALWMGPQYTDSAVILKILTAAMVLHLVEMPSRTVLMGLSKHSILAWSRLIQAAANLGLSVLLVHYYGITGVAIGTLIPMVLVTVVAVFVYFRRYLKLPLGSYLLRSMPLPFVIQIPFVAMLGLINAYSPPSTLSMFFIEIAVALVPYIGFVIVVCVSQSERRAFLRFAERFGLKLSPRFS